MRNARLILLALIMSVPAWGGAGAQRGGAVSGQPSPAAFWAELGDPMLERLIVRALEANPDLRAADARVRAARAGRTDAALALAPTITASSGYSRQRFASVSAPDTGGPLAEQDLWDAGVQMSWELDVFGQQRRTLEGRRAQLASAEEDVRDVQVLLAAEVAREYFDLRGAQDRLAVAQRNAENQRRTLDVTLERIEAGRGNALDSERAQAQLSSTLAAIPSLEAVIAGTQHRIGVLLGRPPASVAPELGDGGRMWSLPTIEVDAAPEELVRERADVRSSERRLAARRAFVAAAKADYLPRVSVGGVAGYTASTFDRLGTSGTPRYAIGPVVSWPLLDLGRVKASVDAARAGEAEAAAQYRHAILRASQEVATSLVTYDRARERLQHLEDAADASTRATELALLRFEEGATGFLEVLDTERTQLEAQDRLAVGRREATAGLVAVYRALGGKGSWMVN